MSSEEEIPAEEKSLGNEENTQSSPASSVPEDENSQSNKASPDDEPETTQPEPETLQPEPDPGLILDQMHSDINYGIILSFLDKFGKHLSIKEFAIFKNLESNLTNTKNCIFVFFQILF